MGSQDQSIHPKPALDDDLGAAFDRTFRSKSDITVVRNTVLKLCQDSPMFRSVLHSYLASESAKAGWDIEITGAAGGWAINEVEQHIWVPLDKTAAPDASFAQSVVTLFGDVFFGRPYDEADRADTHQLFSGIVLGEAAARSLPPSAAVHPAAAPSTNAYGYADEVGHRHARANSGENDGSTLAPEEEGAVGGAPAAAPDTISVRAGDTWYDIRQADFDAIQALVRDTDPIPRANVQQLFEANFDYRLADPYARDMIFLLYDTSETFRRLFHRFVDNNEGGLKIEIKSAEFFNNWASHMMTRLAYLPPSREAFERLDLRYDGPDGAFVPFHTEDFVIHEIGHLMTGLPDRGRDEPGPMVHLTNVIMAEAGFAGLPRLTHRVVYYDEAGERFAEARYPNWLQNPGEPAPEARHEPPLPEAPQDNAETPHVRRRGDFPEVDAGDHGAPGDAGHQLGGPVEVGHDAAQGAPVAGANDTDHHQPSPTPDEGMICAVSFDSCMM